MTRPRSMYRKKVKEKQENPIAKRKKVVLNLIQREELIQKSKSGVSVKQLSLDYNVGKSTVYDIISRDDQQIAKFRSENPNSTNRSTFTQAPVYPLIHQALDIWFNQARTSKTTINPVIVAEQAKEFCAKFYPENYEYFVASSVVDIFCKRHCIDIELNEENTSKDQEEFDPFLVKIEPINEEYSPDQSDYNDNGYGHSCQSFHDYPVVDQEEVVEPYFEGPISANEAFEAFQVVKKWLNYRGSNIRVDELEEYIHESLLDDFTQESPLEEYIHDHDHSRHENF